MAVRESKKLLVSSLPSSALDIAYVFMIYFKESVT